MSIHEIVEYRLSRSWVEIIQIFKKLDELSSQLGKECWKNCPHWLTDRKTQKNECFAQMTQKNKSKKTKSILKRWNWTNLPPPSAQNEMKGTCDCRAGIKVVFNWNTEHVNRQWASLSESRKLFEAHYSSASWGTNGASVDKIQVQVQTTQENEALQNVFQRFLDRPESTGQWNLTPPAKQY